MSVRSWGGRLREGLSKSATRLGEGLSRVFERRRLDPQTLEEFEDVLIEADFGVHTAAAVVAECARHRDARSEDIRHVLVTVIADILRPVARPLRFDPSLKPSVLLMVGVNGSGKTTTIGKLAAQQTGQGRTVMIAAGDTFRAAAVEQLHIWATRAGATLVSGPPQADAAGLAHDACSRSLSEGADILLIDTAGRLHNKSNLMDELAKIQRAVGKAIPGAPHEVILVLDAGAGQNVLAQVEQFQSTVPLQGLILTKLDGSARGGIVVALAGQFKLPIYAVGVGEAAADLQPFAPELFAKALVGLADA